MSCDDVPTSDDAVVRKLTDPRAMRALAHPVRLALIELLTLDGPHTATEAAERIGESPSNCSFHLRQLAKYGFVEETGDGVGRRRPWRRVLVGLSYSDAGADGEVVGAARALTDLALQRVLHRWEQWQQRKHTYPVEWQELAGMEEALWWLTPDELAEIHELLSGLASRYLTRMGDPAERPEGAEPVEFLGLMFPVRPPTGD